jgi:pyrroline-5-carboxylate reductase
MTSSLLLVGCGKMGSALLARWQHTHPAGIQHFFVVEPDHYHANTPLVTWVTSLESLPGDFVPDIIVFAVKPQLLPSLLPEYRARFSGAHPLFISIAAGKTLRAFSTQLGEHARVVRAMPNTAALIGEAMTVLCAAPSVSAAARNIATQLMQAVGQVIWIEDESQMDAVTALSGSGPAYVFLFLESLTNAGVAAGLPPDVARSLAIKTVSGSCALAAQSSEPFEILRKNVTSPGGTTEAALGILMNDGKFEKLLTEAVSKAVKRSHELSE